MQKRNRLTADHKMQVLAMIARGDTSTQINDNFEAKYEVSISPSTVAHIKKSHPEALSEMRSVLAEQALSETQEILNRSRRMINRRLKRADKDEDALEEASKKYRDGEIGYDAYKRIVDTARSVSLDQLTRVAKEMHAQTVDTNPDAKSPSDPRALNQLTEAIKRGDTVELQRIILNGNTTTAAG